MLHELETFLDVEDSTLASSPGRMSRTAVWISRDEIVDFLLYEANLEASPATRSKISFTVQLAFEI